ncbi:MAG: hypothetical protein M0D55_06640 [Elusimicrobiota bacterium]|nr:MAG: hypothetical protein M0D55_06640 [Elusimicrobiota bacterium]
MFKLWNETDKIFASPEEFATEAKAEAFAVRFRRRFLTQGYYLTFDRRRIAPEEAELVVVPAEP